MHVAFLAMSTAPVRNQLTQFQKEVWDEGRLSDEQKASTLQWNKDLKEWRQGETVTKQKIASSIPDSLFMKIKRTAGKIWRELEKHFQNRSQMVSIDLRRQLQDQCCPEMGDVIIHFATLCTMREDLASMGQPLSENDFYAIILGSLPPSFDPYISAVNATSSVLGTTLSANDLMLTITEEYERRNLKSKSGKKDENVALYSNDTGKGWKGGLSSKKNVKCFNCGKKGHYKSDCWASGGGKEGQGPSQKGKGKQKEKEKGKGSAAAAKEKEKEKVEEAWLAMMISDKSQDKFKDMPDLINVNSDSEAFETESNDDVLSYVDSNEVGNLFEEISTQDGYSNFDELYELTNYTSDPSEFIPNISNPSHDESKPYPFEAAYSSFNADDLAGSAKTKALKLTCTTQARLTTCLGFVIGLLTSPKLNQYLS